MKARLSWIALAVALAVPAQARERSAARRAAVPSAAASAVQQAKALLKEGRRKQAIEQLDKARLLAKSRIEQRELASRRALFAEQFLTAESFQKFQEASGLAELERWDECLRELDPVDARDQDNLLVLRLRAACQFSLKQYDPATKTFQAVLALSPGDLRAGFGLVEISLAQRKFPQGLSLLQTLEPKASPDVERHAILKSRLLELSDRPADAAEALRQDQESYLDHVEVLYELGMLYSRMPGHDWPARKLLSLFVSRCKRMKEAELKGRRFDLLLPQAQTALGAIDKRLGV